MLLLLNRRRLFFLGAGFLLLVLGFALRIHFSRTAFNLTFDSATPGVMALRILEGERPLFYYGQNYFGAIEAYAAALLIKLFGFGQFQLTLSPILFTLAWISAMGLLFRELYGPRAGLVAMACSAFPAWDLFWYSIGPYGGYPTALFLGTLVLWLAVRLLDRGEHESVSVVAIGLLAGIAVWTHYLVANYLLVALVLLLLHAKRRGFARKPLLLAGSLGALLFLTAISPCVLAFGKYGGDEAVGFSFRPDDLAASLGAFVRRVLPRLVVWKSNEPLPWLWFSLLPLLVATLWTSWALFSHRAWPRWKRLVPPAVVMIFFLLYLPNKLSVFGVPRYTFVLSSVFAASAFGIPLAVSRGWKKYAALALAGLWVSYHGVSALRASEERHPAARKDLSSRLTVVDAARATGEEFFLMAGGFIFGLDGQTYTFFAQNKIQFVSAYDERHQPTAERFECADSSGIAVEREIARRLESSLEAMRVDFQRAHGLRAPVFHEFGFPPVNPLALLPESAVLTPGVVGEATSLFDFDHDTRVKGLNEKAAGVVMDFGSPVKLCGFWLTGAGVYQEDLPESHVLSVSDDGVNFREIHRAQRRMVPAYTEDERVYIKGYLGRLDIAFKPEHEARYWKLELAGFQRKQKEWCLTQIVPFAQQDGGEQGVPSDFTAIASAIRRHKLEFVYAGRRMSALIEREFPGQGKAFPRLNPKFKATHLSREFFPNSSSAVLVPASMAELTLAFIRQHFGEKAVASSETINGHRLILLSSANDRASSTSSVAWNGHFFELDSNPLRRRF